MLSIYRGVEKEGRVVRGRSFAEAAWKIPDLNVDGSGEVGAFQEFRFDGLG